MSGKLISMTTEKSAGANVMRLLIKKATNIDFSDVATTGSTYFIVKTPSNLFHAIQR